MGYIDAMLPFRLSSEQKIFNAVADALNWDLHQLGTLCPSLSRRLYHCRPSPSTQCQELLALLDIECNSLGVPIAAHKRDSPTTCLTYLGIEIDTVQGQLTLPQAKVHHLLSLLKSGGTE